jgi:colicin import membrane protein
LTPEQQESLTRKAETPHDQTPAYVPEHVLSPEFEGVSNYERGVDSFLDELKQKLEKLKNLPESSEKEIRETENEITYLESLHENFYIGMNVFRTASGGRDKVKK